MFIVVEFIAATNTLWCIFSVTLYIPLFINIHVDVAITVAIHTLQPHSCYNIYIWMLLLLLLLVHYNRIPLITFTYGCCY